MSPAEADAIIRSHTAPFLREDCPLLQAHGRVLREDLRADRDLPPFDRVMMDGYALNASAAGDNVTEWQVIAMQAAGMRPIELPEGRARCVEVATGAVLPTGADCVVPYEQTERTGEQVKLVAGTALTAGMFVHRKGSDHAAGAVVVPAGTRLAGGEIAAAAAVGAATVTVSVRPKIAVIATGDELVEVEHPVTPHQIRRSNDYALRAALALGGFPDVDRLHVRDVRHEVDRVLQEAIAAYDVVILTGGVSRGKFDLLPSALEARGVRKLVRGVAQRPGKPFWFGITQRRTPVFALPGNPVSSYTCLHRYVLPALQLASGAPATGTRRVAVRERVDGLAALTRFLPVRLLNDEDGEQRAAIAPTNTSGDFSGLVGTDGFVELTPSAGPIERGGLVPFFAWR